MRKVHYNPRYGGRKLGDIIVSYSPKSSCPDTCSLKSGGCYAWDLFYLKLLGNKIETGLQTIKKVERPFVVKTLADALNKRSASCKIVRHRVAGDIIGDVEETVKDCLTVEANGLINVGYTHAWKEVGVEALKPFFRASCQSFAEVEEARALGWATTVILDKTLGKGKHNVNGEKIVMCPIDDYNKSMTCNSCRLCRIDSKTEDVTVAFVLHGNGAKTNANKVQGV